MHSLRLLIAAAATALGFTCVSAQVWTRDSNFAPALHDDMPALTNTTLVPAPDGRVLAWGSFTHLGNGTFASRGLAYLRADGTPDQSFVSGVASGDAVFTAAPLANGMVLAQILHNGLGSIVRFLANGQIDATYTPLSADYRLNFTQLPDGRILAWANYVRVAGIDRNHLARFNADGTLDTTFTSGLPTSTANMGAVAAQSDGKLYVSTYGQSSSWTSLGAGRLVRLNADGSVDPSFAGRDVADAYSTLAVQPDGKLLAGAGKVLTRLAADGSNDGTFTATIPNLQKIERIAVRSDGQIVVQADIGTTGTVFPSDVLFISANGAVQRDIGATLLPGETVTFDVVETDGTLLVTHGLPQPVIQFPPGGVETVGSNAGSSDSNSGSSTVIAPIPPAVMTVVQAKLGRVAADGSRLTSADPGLLDRLPGYIGRGFTDSNSRFIVSGSFTDVSGTPRPGIARFLPTGALDTSFAPNLNGATLENILLIGADGSTLGTESVGAVGADGSYQTTTRIVRIAADGSVGAPFVAPASDIRWLAIGSDGRILVSYFVPDNTAESNLHLRWLNADGTVATTLPTRFSGLPKQTILIGIPIEASSGAGATTAITSGNLAPSDGTATTTTPGYSNAIGIGQPLADGHILVAGLFTDVNGTAVSGLVRLNADGSLDTSYKPDLSGFSGTVYTSNPDSQGRVIVSGQIWDGGQLAWTRWRLLANGQRDPSYAPYQLPSTVTAVRWLDNGLPDLNFPNKVTQPDGSTAQISSALTASDGTVWTMNPLARFTASDVPSITVPPSDQSVVAGHTALFLVGIGTRDAATYQWSHEGTPIDGATLPYLQLADVQASQAGHYRVTVAVDGQTITSSPALLTVVGGASRIVNFSALTTTAPGATPIAGFMIGGNGAARSWLLRAMGPSLSKFGVSGTVADPQLDLFSDATPVAHNSGGAGDNDAALLAQSVGAFPVAFPFPALLPWSRESAVIATLAPGAYTAQATSASGGSGLTLLEVYDSIPNGASGSLRNMSIRSALGGAAHAPVLGFVIKGVVPLHLLIRGVGPTLGSLGVPHPIGDPDLAVYHGSTAIASNAGWANNADVAAAAKTIGTFALPAGSRDSGVVLTLDPGAYTVSLTSDSGGSGEGLIEAYVLDPQ